MTEEEMLAEIERLRGIIARNKHNYLALQALCAKQRAELEEIRATEIARKLILDEAIRQNPGSEAIVQMASEALAEVADAVRQHKSSDDN